MLFSLTAGVNFLYGKLCGIGFQSAAGEEGAGTGQKESGFLHHPAFGFIALKPVEEFADMGKRFDLCQKFREGPDTVEYHGFPAIRRNLQDRPQILPLNFQ